MVNLSQVYVGVDISKKHLDIYIHPLGKSLKVDNKEGDMHKIIDVLDKYDNVKIACEATGGYEKLLAQHLKKSSYDLWIIDPRRVKGFIVASGCKSKTDKIDAQKIAEFASKNSRGYQSLDKTEHHEQMLGLVNRKNDLTKFLIAEKTRLQHPSHATQITNIKKFIKILESQIKSIDQQIESIIKNDEILIEKSKILESIPGIGKASAAALLSFVPELGQISNTKISALVGLCHL